MTNGAGSVAASAGAGTTEAAAAERPPPVPAAIARPANAEQHTPASTDAHAARTATPEGHHGSDGASRS